MKIENIIIESYTIPLPVPVKAFAAGLMTGFDIIITRIFDENGNEGQGYTTGHTGFGSSIVRIIEDSYKPILLGADSSRIEYLWNKMWKKLIM